MESKFNNTRQILESDSTWYGLNEVTTGFTNIAFNIITTQNVTLTISQSIDGIIYDFVDEYVHFTNISGNESTTQFAVKAQFFKCSVHNDSLVDINNFVITTLFLDTSRDSSLQQPAIIAGSVSVLNGIKATDYTFNTLRDVACDDTGHLLVSSTFTPSGTQDVNIVSSINLNVTPPHLSYLTDNVAVATIPPITGTVAVSSQPHLSYLNDNVAVVTMPAITGTVAVSSQPHLSYLTDNIAVATQPALTFATDKADVTGSSVSISSGAITETNSGTISSTLTTLNGKVTACNTGAVVISSALPNGTNTIGKVYTFENPSFIANLTNLGDTGQTIKSSAGSLFNLTCFNDGNAVAYIKIYNVAVPTASDTPIMTLPISHDVAINTISTHNFQFSTAIGVRATANYIANDTTSPAGTTSVVAFYNGIAL